MEKARAREIASKEKDEQKKARAAAKKKARDERDAVKKAAKRKEKAAEKALVRNFLCLFIPTTCYISFTDFMPLCRIQCVARFLAAMK